jgi:glycosyltransferase involved in cell wall biosynthesis
MEIKLPLISIIMATFNRACTIERAIDSVINQSYKNIELIIIDDGSTDNTSVVLNKYNNERIRIYLHDYNKGVTAAKNTGLKLIKGEWFTTFDSDDEMVPDAIETMINIPLYFDNEITAVTCNCWEPISKTFIGHGLTEDCYIFANEILPSCRGDFWGITKTSLLQGDTFNEKLIGTESTLWYRINERANRYYVHKALNIIHIESKDRVSTKKASFEKEIIHYENLINEELYLKLTKQYRPDDYYCICRKGLLVMLACKNEFVASKYYELLKSFKASIKIDLIFKYKLLTLLTTFFLKLEYQIKKFVY